MNENRDVDCNEVYKEAIDTFGDISQMMMVIEEMAELQKEISKNFRGEKNITHIAEEIADVEIMLEQMKLLFDISKDVEVWREAKTKRLFNKTNNHKAKQLIGREIVFDMNSVVCDDLYSWLDNNKEEPLLIKEVNVEKDAVWFSDCPYSISIEECTFV